MYAFEIFQVLIRFLLTHPAALSELPFLIKSKVIMATGKTETMTS
jgi:hypothetical protein